MFLALARWNDYVSYMRYRSGICRIIQFYLVLIFTLPLLGRKTFRLTATLFFADSRKTEPIHDTYICNLLRRSVIITKENPRRIIGFGRYLVALPLQFSTDELFSLFSVVGLIFVLKWVLYSFVNCGALIFSLELFNYCSYDQKVVGHI